MIPDDDLNAPVPADLPPAPPPDDGNAIIPLSLDEFCARLSRRDRRVELIAAFHFHLRHQRNLTFATEPEFFAQFAAFTGA